MKNKIKNLILSQYININYLYIKLFKKNNIIKKYNYIYNIIYFKKIYNFIEKYINNNNFYENILFIINKNYIKDINILKTIIIKNNYYILDKNWIRGLLNNLLNFNNNNNNNKFFGIKNMKKKPKLIIIFSNYNKNIIKESITNGIPYICISNKLFEINQSIYSIPKFNSLNNFDINYNLLIKNLIK